METSASCEARYAPLLYPTNQVGPGTQICGISRLFVAQLARDRHARLAQTFLHEFAAIEPMQLEITARVSAGFVPEDAQKRTALLG